MNEKEIVLQILERIKLKIKSAEGLIFLVKNNGLNSSGLKLIISKLKQELRNTKNEEDSKILNNSIKQLETIKIKEEKSRQNEQAELEEMEALLGI